MLNGQLVPPSVMDQLVSNACGRRPAIVIISACFSGVFVPVMADPNRMILTAARPDRGRYSYRCTVPAFRGISHFECL